MRRETNGRTAIEAVDLLVWEVVTASGDLSQGPECGLSRLLRETAAAALAGVGQACREDCRRRGIERLATVLDELRRLATWLDLAERFGDLSAGRALPALESQARALAAVDRLQARWLEAAETGDPVDYATVEVTLPTELA
ncbi:MAG TPA: hypothetical protein VM617_04440 [Thermoanaerobaculia bacterium]|nr:hypothetical protein [Thermoanaerobaculia bacterium]